MANENFAINIDGPENATISAYGMEIHAPTGNWPLLYVYSFVENFSNTYLLGAIACIQDDSDPDLWNYVTNEKAVLAPFKPELVAACIENFELKFGVTPTDVGMYGQKSSLQERYLVEFDADTYYIATEYRNLATGLRQVLYSVENSAGATTTMLNAIRFFETDFNVWDAPVQNPNLIANFGNPVRVAMLAHWNANFNL